LVARELGDSGLWHPPMLLLLTLAIVRHRAVLLLSLILLAAPNCDGVTVLTCCVHSFISRRSMN
jgi:hypothetical protein